MHIGLFDSGVGGLTVLRELKKTLPSADFTYLGDTARLPYGNKAPETLAKYTDENIAFLESKGVDIIVIACHSASSVSLHKKKSPQGVPILNVITPSGLEAKAVTKNNRVAVMATKATIRSNVYTRYFSELDDKVDVTSQECPLLVPLVEEDLLEDEVTDFILRRYLIPILKKGCDTIILGCTHYPVLREQILKIVGSQVSLIDPADTVAQEILKKHGPSKGSGKLKVYLTDHSPHFITHAKKLLGELQEVTFLLPEF